VAKKYPNCLILCISTKSIDWTLQKGIATVSNWIIDGRKKHFDEMLTDTDTVWIFLSFCHPIKACIFKMWIFPTGYTTFYSSFWMHKICFQTAEMYPSSSQNSALGKKIKPVKYFLLEQNTCLAPGGLKYIFMTNCKVSFVKCFNRTGPSWPNVVDPWSIFQESIFTKLFLIDGPRTHKK
jgi:hypothetical protein